MKLAANGTVLLAYRADDHRFVERVSVGRSSRSSVSGGGGGVSGGIFGPFDDPRTAPAVDAFAEDPFLWQDERGHWHMLMHHLFNHVGDPVGAHAFSRDAITWTKSDVLPYTTFVPFSDGSSVNLTRRERPELVLSAKGQPRYLSSGAQEVHGDHTYTLVMRVAGGEVST